MSVCRVVVANSVASASGSEAVTTGSSLAGVGQENRKPQHVTAISRLSAELPRQPVSADRKSVCLPVALLSSSCSVFAVALLECELLKGCYNDA